MDQFLSLIHISGACAAEAYFDAAIAFCLEHDLLLAHDNAYCDICFDGYRAPSILERPHAKECCIEFFSLSKSYNMTGWRIAFEMCIRDSARAGDASSRRRACRS